MNGSFKTKPWPKLADCDPGLRVLEYKVLVLMPQLEAVSSGGIMMSDATKDKEELAQTTAMLVSVSPMAFQFADWPRDRVTGELINAHLVPVPGDLVRFKQYAGGEWRGRDGRNYRIIDDKEIYGVSDDKDAPQPEAPSSIVQVGRAPLVFPVGGIPNGAAR